MGDARLWHVAPVERRVAVPLDSLTALYDRASGQTHLLASPLPEIIEALNGGPADTATITARLAASFDLDSDDAEATIAARLEELVTLGLVTQT